MKYIILSIITISLCSCQKHDFDLADIKLPMKKETFTGKFKCDEGSDFVEAVTYKTTDEAALWFGDEKLSGNMVDGNSSFGTNQVRFQLVKKTNKIEAYQLQVETEKESLKLEKSLDRKFGKADFYYQNKEFSFKIWEFNQNTYFLEINNTTVYNGKKTITANLNVVNNKNELLFNYYIAGGFQYYGDYLYEKKKPEHQNQTYTYHDFVNQKESEDGKDSYFVKDFVK